MLTDSSPQPSAYDLVTKEVKDLTEADIRTIVADLRIKRQQYLSGVQDRAPKAKAAPKSAEEKQAVTDSLLGDLLGGGGK